MTRRALNEEHFALRAALRELRPGQRVAYHGWRGDSGEGVVLRFLNANGEQVEPANWGTDRSDAIVVKRSFSADEGRHFLPFAGDGDTIRAV